MIQLIVTDLDGTLLQSNKLISARTLAALHACRAKDIKIVFATARSTQAAQQMIGQFEPDILVSYGGALAVEGQKVIHRCDMDAEVASALIRRCLAEPGITSISAVNETTALTNRHPGAHEQHVSHYRYDDFSQAHHCRYLKISVHAADSAIVERIATAFPMCDMLHYTGETLYRFANKQAVKWVALQAIAAHYGLSTQQFVAFGDDTNDIQMIQGCGTGIAMGNAIDAVKAVADGQCDTNDNSGVAQWLEAHVL